MDLFQKIFDRVDEALDSYIIETAGNLIEHITPIFTSMLIIWIAIWGYAMMFGKVAEPLQEGVFRILRIGFIMALGLTIGTYMDVVVDVLAHGPESIAAVITGSSGGAASVIDGLMSKIMDVAQEAWEEAGILDGDFGMYLVAAFIIIAGGIVTVVVAFLILVSKIGTTVLLAVGPIFIIGLLFNATQRFFEAWLAQVMNFGVLLVLGSALGNMILDLGEIFMDRMIASGADLSSVWAAVEMVCFFALCGLFLKQVPAIASALGGGVALATQGALSSAMKSMGGMRPSNVHRQARIQKGRLKKDAQAIGTGAALAGKAAAAPYTAPRAAKRAYQKRFGANTLTGT